MPPLNRKKIAIDIPEYRQFGKLKLISLSIIGLIIFGLGIGSFFIYKNIYETIDQMQNIVILKSQLGMEIIDFDKLDRVKKIWTEKNDPHKIKPARNPFTTSYAPQTTSTTLINTF